MYAFRCPPSYLQRWIVLLSLPVVLTSFLPSTSRARADAPETHAPTPPASVPQGAYDALIADAVREYRLRNFAEARALFTRANALIPNARALRGIGMAEYELRNYSACVAMLRSALASSTQPLTSALRADSEAMLADAERYIGHFQLEVQPSAYALKVDGMVVAQDPALPLDLTVGDHTLEVQAPGHLSARSVLKVSGGERETLRFTLVRDEPVQVAPIPPPAPLVDAKPRRLARNAWLWGGVGVAIVTAAAVGLGIGLRDKDSTALPASVSNPVAIRRGP